MQGLRGWLLHQLHCRPVVLDGLRRRWLLSQGGAWPAELTTETRLAIEAVWSDRLAQSDERAFSDFDSSSGGDLGGSNREKFYVLCMFPYPSGRLHMGHLRVYTLGDVVTRFHRSAGRRVLHPMGWDAFGLPAENAAAERGLPAERWTRDNIAAMRQQLRDMRLCFDWSREFATCDPEYYKWTQWIFVQLFKAGLCYRRKAFVNWDPVDQTVLADELVDAEGRSWRSGAKVEQRPLTQWFVRISAYYESLLAGLDTVRSDQWREVARMQRGWLGKLDGTYAQFRLTGPDGEQLDEDLQVFTQQPATLRAVSHLEVTRTSCLMHRFPDLLAAATPRLLPLRAVNPVTQATLGVAYRPDLTFSRELAVDCRAAVPEFDSDDGEVAHRLGVQRPASMLDTSDGRFLGHVGGGLAGLTADSEEAFNAALAELRQLGAGGHRCSALRRDWLVSRQRRWGTPIPMLHCPGCGTVPVPEADLPVRPDASPVAECPQCGRPANRDNETLDTFVDSSWYYLRFLDPRNPDQLCSAEKAKKLMPVDLYIGGMEHAVRHLYYARFVCHFLHSLGLTPAPEPFDQFLPVGLVLGRTCRTPDGRYVPPAEVDAERAVHLPTGQPVAVTRDKMSKSKHNGVDPSDVLRRLSVDTTRLCLLASTAPQSDRVWDEADILTGVVNWQRRLWRLVGDLLAEELTAVVADNNAADAAGDPDDRRLLAARQQAAAAALLAYEATYGLSVAIARMQTLTSQLLGSPLARRRSSLLHLETQCLLVYLLAPMAPMFAAEMWLGLAACLGRHQAAFAGQFRFDRGVGEQPPDEALAFVRRVAASRGARSGAGKAKSKAKVTS